MNKPNRRKKNLIDTDNRMGKGEKEGKEGVKGQIQGDGRRIDFGG